MIIKAEDFKPKVRGESDFYSWQLYRWLKKYPDYSEVWSGTWNSATGHDPERPVLYIGKMFDDGWFHGKNLRSTCVYKAKIQAWAFSNGHHVEEWTDCTEAFWTDYRLKGVCAIHGDNAHEWDTDGKERQCKFCGKREIQKAVMVQKLVWEQV